MDAADFINAANAEARKINTDSSMRVMDAFGGGGQAEQQEANDFSSKDFSDGDFTSDDFADENFNDDSFTDEDFASDPHSIEEGPSIISVKIVVGKLKKSETIYDELREFFELHLIDTSNVVEQNLFMVWNNVYNEKMENNEACLAEYFKLRHGLWFDNMKTMQFAIEQGVDFLQCFKMERRVCNMEDIKDVLKVWNEDWFNPEVFSDLSNESSLNLMIFDIMRKHLDVTLLYPFREDSIILASAMKLLLIGRLNSVEFADAAHFGSDSIENYVDYVIQGNVDRFTPIINRPDFQELYQMIVSHEANGHPIRDEVIQKYADAFYLRTIITAEAEERLDFDFSNVYLINDLMNWDFVARLYEQNKIDLSLCRESATLAKILTDVNALNLNSSNFAKEHLTAMKYLLLSRFNGSLSDVDYRKFLAISSFNGGENVLTLLDQWNRQIDSYSQFWMGILLQHLDVVLFDSFTEKIGDNIIYFQVLNGKLKSTYLQIDDFIFHQTEFLQQIGNARYGRVIAGEHGILLCDFDNISTDKFVGGFLSDSSLTTWASGNVDIELFSQFATKNPLIHSNLIAAIDAANKKFVEEQIKLTGVSDNAVMVHSAIQKFFDIPLREYFKNDKMFAFIVKNPDYLGLLKSPNSYSYLVCLARSYHFYNVGMLLFQFLFFVFQLLLPGKVSTSPANFKTLNPNSSVIFVKGIDGRYSTMSIKVLMDSLDDLLAAVHNSLAATLWIENNTVNLSIS